MVILKSKDIKSMTKEELEEKLRELKKEIMKERVQISTGTALKSPGQIKATKKTIARILTHLNQKKL